jgi:hypothetical protein
VKPDPCIVVRPSARIVARVDPAVAEMLAARPRIGTGARIGVIRRIVAPVIVCASVAGAAPIPREPVETPAPAAHQVITLPLGHATPVPAPGAGLIFVTACLTLAWLRRSGGTQGRRWGCQRRHVFLPKLARRVSPRAGQLFGWKR